MNTTFTSMFNYCSNFCQKNILGSNRVPSPDLVQFSLMVSLNLKIQGLHVLPSLAYTQQSNKYPKVSSLIVAKSRCLGEKDTCVAIPSQPSSPSHCPTLLLYSLDEVLTFVHHAVTRIKASHFRSYSRLFETLHAVSGHGCKVSN